MKLICCRETNNKYSILVQDEFGRFSDYRYSKNKVISATFTNNYYCEKDLCAMKINRDKFINGNLQTDCDTCKYRFLCLTESLAQVYGD
jgi:hypothetical protein